jgi:hypothetical protein
MWELVGFEVLAAIFMTVAIFWDIVLFSPPAALWFLARPNFGSVDGGDKFPRNVDSHTDYTTPHTDDDNIL